MAARVVAAMATVVDVTKDAAIAVPVARGVKKDVLKVAPMVAMKVEVMDAAIAVAVVVAANVATARAQDRVNATMQKSAPRI